MKPRQKMHAIESLLNTRFLSNESFQALKEIAKDLRAQQPERRSQALADLAAAIDSAKAVGASSQKEQNRLMHVGQVAIQHWAVIRQAMEKFKENER